MATRNQSRSSGRRSSGRANSRNNNGSDYEETPDYGSAFERPDNEAPQPRFTGTGVLSTETLKAIHEAGGEFQIAVWTRRANTGTRYLRVHIEPPYDGGDDQADEDEDPDDIPW